MEENSNVILLMSFSSNDLCNIGYFLIVTEGDNECINLFMRAMSLLAKKS